MLFDAADILRMGKDLFVQHGFTTNLKGSDWLRRHFPNHRIPRTSTKNKMFRNLNNNLKNGSVSSYCGLLSHGNTFELRQKVCEDYS